MGNTLKDIRIARVSTVPFFVFTQLRAQLDALSSAEAEVYIVTSNDDLSDSVKTIDGCAFNPIYIAREISLWADCLALFKLWKFFREKRFHIVHSTTPKAGLLCAIAAKFAGVPVRIHTFTGQPWVTMSGIKRWIVQRCDKLIAQLNILCYTDSFSQRDFLIQNKIISSEKLKVIGRGSLAGVDVKRFSKDRFSTIEKNELKKVLHIDSEAKILLFIGRVTREKGVFELFDAVESLLKKEIKIELVVVGPFEQHNEVEIREAAQKSGGNKIHFMDFQAEPERFISIADLLCLPSYREGFGTVVIEAAAMGVPVVGTKIYGLKDAIVDEVTGILVESQNKEQLEQAIEQLITDNVLRDRLGKQAHERALADFDSYHFNKMLIEEYKNLLCRYEKEVRNI